MKGQTPVVIVDKSSESIGHLTSVVTKFDNGLYVEDTAANMQEGYDLICKKRPVVAIIDVSTGEIDSALQGIKKIVSAMPLTAVFVICDDSSPETILKFLRAGAHEFFPKPVSEIDLSAAFEKLRNSINEKDFSKDKGCRTYSVFNSKSGAGTSTIAINLAADLYEITKDPTIVVDLNFVRCDVTTFLNIQPKYTIGDITRNINRVDKSFLGSIITQHRSGISVLAAPQDVIEGNSVVGTHVQKLLELLKTMFTYIVIDTEANFAQNTRTAIGMSDLVIVPFAWNLPSSLNVQRCLNHLKNIGVANEKVRLVGNRFLDKAELKPEDVKRLVKQPVCCKIPNDFTTAMMCLNKGITFNEYAPSSRLNLAIMELALRMSGNAAECDDAIEETKKTEGMKKRFQEILSYAGLKKRYSGV
jgi:pilus assembly protein CpaE